MPIRSRIFVIDDDPTVCDLLTDTLSAEFSVFTECDPQIASDRARRGQFDLFIVDLNMPYLNGEQAILQLRSTPDWPDIPIVVLSGSGEASRRVAGMNVQAVIKKPFSSDRLLEAIRALLPMPS